MYGVVGREIDREAGLDGRGDQAPVLDSDWVVAEDGLVDEGDCAASTLGDLGVQPRPLETMFDEVVGHLHPVDDSRLCRINLMDLGREPTLNPGGTGEEELHELCEAISKSRW